VTEVPGTVPYRKGIEAVAVTLYRARSGRSPLANFGGMPAGYRKSTGNNAKLAGAGRRARGGPDPSAPARPASMPVNGVVGRLTYTAGRTRPRGSPMGVFCEGQGASGWRDGYSM